LTESIKLSRRDPQPIEPVKGRGPGSEQPNGRLANRGRKAARLRGVDGKERRNCHGVEGGGRDADRYAGGRVMLELGGARFIERCPITRQGENLVVLSDPWVI